MRQIKAGGIQITGRVGSARIETNQRLMVIRVMGGQQTLIKIVQSLFCGVRCWIGLGAIGLDHFGHPIVEVMRRTVHRR